ncbi:uncharacterized protein EV154DRAFT_466062 [Mucor mucedo]|uniref:uncharacterized protein n=1 Tax=Mucor mucedo TaxID=29922 RepID=UPI0022207D15|nr:uncharacterized protein EV154DRAFT_466062 [Mucor mucedo]KAI7890146.1 hypothetical protein EV154DRAFT_466062 [Mucor mucedo]
MLKANRTQKEAGDLLGTYMLQGWIMTDEICSVESCSFPLMSSKDRSLQFCTFHDSLPSGSANESYKTKAAEQKPKENEVDDMQDELMIRRQRREQSSKASQLIGQKMLQRWALLNEHCPNESCYAVPLVRNPDTKQMYCVICENIILTEAEALQVEKNKKNKQAAEKREQPQAVEEVKPVHSPVSPKMAEDRKRQKVEKPTSLVTPVKEAVSDYFSSEAVVAALSTKMNELSERVKQCHDPKELSELFKSIKHCAGAIQACMEAGQACDKISF